MSEFEQGFDGGGEFENFDVAGMVGPIVAPADDDVAAGVRVAVVAEVAALEFKFDVDALPAFGADLTLGFAVGEAGLDGFDHVAEFLGDDSEEQDDALFVDRFMAQAAEVEGVAIGWTTLQRRTSQFVRREERRGWLRGCASFALYFVCRGFWDATLLFPSQFGVNRTSLRSSGGPLG